MDPVTITEDKLETGLRGVPVGFCPTSQVDPYKGLTYSGVGIGKLCKKDPLEVVYLLMTRKSPSEVELNEFKEDLSNRARKIPEGLDAFLKGLPKKGHPMKWFNAGLIFLGMNGEGDYREDFYNLTAWLPELVAKIFVYREGREANASDPSLGYIENFIHIMNVDADEKKLTELMRVFHVLHLDHGGGNLSTFVGKAIASGLEDFYGSIAGAMSALAGPRHGMANQECLSFIISIIDELGDKATDDTAMYEYLKKRYENKELIYGFGHAVLRVEDLRATALFELGEEICPDHEYFKVANVLRKVGSEFLKTKEKIADPYVNVDSASGSLLYACGLEDPNYYTVLFGMSRCIGIGIQILYERLEARGGKGTPIIRPKYIYSGPAVQE